jgi:non-heme Fe2+,alpha-ketoglutarate-dependent halogenase
MSHDPSPSGQTLGHISEGAQRSQPERRPGLSAGEIARYRREGWISPLRAFDESSARRYRALLEAGERAHGLDADQRRKLHLYLSWVDEIIRLPSILDSVESIIGPDILVYHITLWMKEPRSEAFISWHQDSTYFGLEPNDQHLTAWVALSDSHAASGCVQVLPGSHMAGQRPHHARLDPDNLFRTGQTVEVGEAAPGIETLPLAPGEFSLHHTHLLHNSMPNQSSDRRIGLGISYIPAYCRCKAPTRLSATLVRGVDRHGHFDLDPRPARDFDPPAVATHRRAVSRWHTAREALIPQAHAQAD